MVLERCLPLAFMPYASRTNRSNPDLVKCSFSRIACTMAAKRQEVATFDSERMLLEERHDSRFEVPKRLDYKSQDATP